MSAGIDVAAPLSAIQDTMLAIASVGVAVLTVFVALHTYRWVRGALDSQQGDGEITCPECSGYLMGTDDPEMGGVYCTDCGWTPLVDDFDFSDAEHDPLSEAESYECAMCGQSIEIGNDTCDGCGNVEIPY